ncbi:MAG: hypothetical protein ABR613_13340 [Actinomycetota bacterium]
MAIDAVVDRTSLHTTAVFGRVDAAVKVVELRLEDGTTVQGAVFPAPRSMEVDFNFFVAMAPGQDGVAIAALRRDGSALGVQRLAAALPILTVDLDGSGEGTVTGKHVCEGCPAGIEMETVIDCGLSCWADMEDAGSIELVATAAEGSVFAGWSGECSGTETCVVRVDADKKVVAIFDEDS